MITEVEEGNNESDKEVPAITSQYTPVNQIHTRTLTHTMAKVLRGGLV